MYGTILIGQTLETEGTGILNWQYACLLHNCYVLDLIQNGRTVLVFRTHQPISEKLLVFLVWIASVFVVVVRMTGTKSPRFQMFSFRLIEFPFLFPKALLWTLWFHFWNTVHGPALVRIIQWIILLIQMQMLQWVRAFLGRQVNAIIWVILTFLLELLYLNTLVHLPWYALT